MTHRTVVLLALVLIAAACGDDGSPEADPSSDTTTTQAVPSEGSSTTTTAPVPSRQVPTPNVTGPITAGDGPVIPQPAAPAPAGYIVEEFFVGGTAVSYAGVGELPPEGGWLVEEAEEAEYQTRILVRRPPRDVFSGVVIVEWLNVSAVEASPDWAYLAQEVGNAGHAYVAVSAQALGVVGGTALLEVEIDEEAAEQLGAGDEEVTEGGLVNADPERYGSLNHPGDAWAFDIFSQVGAALTGAADTVLGGLEPTTVIAIGESQSAGFLTSYLNGVHPIARVFDGFFVHSRGAGAPPLDGVFASSADSEAAESFVQEAVLIRDDLEEPVMILESETDLTLLGYHLARQPDTDRIRTWEVAGTAHSDAHVFRTMVGGPRDPNIGSLLGCTAPINTGPHHEAVAAALHHLVAWAQGGSPPPAAARIELTDDDPVAIARDDLGRALGGVRNPLVDVPVMVPIGDPPAGLSLDRAEGFDVCALFGQTLPLDQATLLELHGSADDYIEAFRASADAAVEAGFLLPGDADDLIAEAEENRALFG